MTNFKISLCRHYRRLFLILLVTILGLGFSVYAAEEPHLQTTNQDKVTTPILPPQSQIQENVVPNEQPLPKKHLSTIIVENYYPYTFVNRDGIPDGYSVDLVKAVTKVMGLEIDIHAGPWDQAMKALETGQIDLLPMMAYSKKRDKLFDFSIPHTISYDAVFVPKNHNTIKSIKDLMGKRVIVMKDDAAHQYLVSKGLITIDRLVLTDSLVDALRLLAAGKGDAALMPKLVGLLNLKKLGLSNLEQSPVVVDDYTRPFSFAVRKGNKALLDRLSDGLSIIKATGEYDQIYSKWFGMAESSEKIMQTVIKYILLTVAAVGCVALLLVAWFLSIRKQVALRTRELQQEIGERKKAEEALRESEEFAKRVIDSSNDCIKVLDLEGNLLLMSSGGQKILEIDDITDYLHRSWIDFFKDKDRESALEAISRAKKDEAGIFYGYCETAKGTPKWWENVITPIKDSNGDINRLLAVSRDITERKQMEEDLRENENKFRSVFERSRIGLILLDGQSLVLDCNQHFADIFGARREDYLGLNLLARMTEGPVRQNLADAIANGGIHRYEGPYTSMLTRQEVTLLITTEKIAPEMYLSIIEDITARKRMEAALISSDERYQTLIRTSMDGFWAVDMEGRILEVNDALCTMSGYSKEALLSMHITDLECIDSSEHIRAYIHDVIAKGWDRFESKHRCYCYRRSGSMPKSPV
ncbi:MAG: transporter substrate-binding domain-containing protein [Deltaproteobacteria bacterium]|nr:transporter substrate-binding domain-containing protein [Deltaproteobacteria bacterium]